MLHAFSNCMKINFGKRPDETDVNGNEISFTEKETNKVGAEVDEDVKTSVELKDTEESNKNNKKYGEINKNPQGRWPPHQQAPQRNPPSQFSRPQQQIIIPNGIVSDTRRFWKRLGELTVSQLKLRRRDIDMVPPKYVKIGFGWTPQVKGEKRRLMYRRKKNPADQIDSFSQYTPYSLPYGISQHLHHRNSDAFSNLLTSPSPPTNFNATSSSLRTRTSTLTPTPVPRKTPLTAINRQISNSNIKFSSLIPQIRKAAADSRTILSKLESSASKSTLPVIIRSPKIPDHHRDRDNATNSKEAVKSLGGGGSLKNTTSTENPSPKYSFNLASLIKYKYANPITTDGEYKPRPNTTLDFGKPTSTPPTTATFSKSNSAVLTRSLYKPTTEFTAKYHHLLAQN